MSDSTPTDPGEAFRKMVTDWERNFDAFANRVMGTEGYSRAMNSAQSSQLRMQQAFAEMMGRQLSAMNIPTREDMLRLSETVASIDRRLARMEDAMGLDTVAAAPAAEAKVRRGRQPPADFIEEQPAATPGGGECGSKAGTDT